MRPRVFLSSLAAGILLFLIVSALSQTITQFNTYLSGIQGRVFLFEAFAFGLILVVGLAGSLLAIALIRPGGDVSAALTAALGVGLIDLGGGMALGRDISLVLIPLSVLVILVLLLRYGAHFLAITGPVFDVEDAPWPVFLLGLAAALSAAIGGFIGSLWTSQYVTAALAGAGSGLALASLVKTLHHVHGANRRVAEFGGLALGFFLALAIETSILVLGRF